MSSKSLHVNRLATVAKFFCLCVLRAEQKNHSLELWKCDAAYLCPETAGYIFCKCLYDCMIIGEQATLWLVAVLLRCV